MPAPKPRRRRSRGVRGRGLPQGRAPGGDGGDLLPRESGRGSRAPDHRRIGRGLGEDPRLRPVQALGRAMKGADAVVVGAGVVGTSVAFHLAERGVKTVVLDREGPAAGSTARSGALIRAHYPTALEADLAWESLTEYLEPWDERVGGHCGFTRTGFAYLVGEQNIDALRYNVALQRKVGVETELVGPDELCDIEPALCAEGIALAAYEPRGGDADPAAPAIGFLRAAQALGGRFERRRATALLFRGERVRGVQTDEGPVEA